MRILVLSSSELNMDADIVQVETVEAARELIAASQFDVVVVDARAVKEVRAITDLPVVTIEEASDISVTRLRETVEQERAFREIQQGLVVAREQAAAGRRALADAFALLGKTPRNRASGGKA